MDSQLAVAVKWFGGSLVVSALILTIGMVMVANRFENALVQSTSNLSSGMSHATSNLRQIPVRTTTLNGEITLASKPLTVRIEKEE